MLRILISLIFVVIAAIVIFYKMPAATKQQTIEAVSEIVPDPIKEKIESLVSTPAQRRLKLLEKLETALSEIKNNVAEDAAINPENVGKIMDKIGESEKIISQIEKTNEESSVINKVTTAVIDKTTGVLTKDGKEEKNCY
ncbi:MAG: hypothetical protein A2745_01995 [Candidatus Harrisonbacteria bacterium RIFCSPHIGHO2_01_FULL_44_13]|uniref:Uncharacterized protein n=1 Tax=Candidatus Harrisonbacteria bacterium RIFCSPLOWO2_01_FULL_44_18 TaxID=1798407 RepID=A0A1G1ZNT8_9BACT|nr:MAG: hypothetical protein A2745_01995 [Candidatus Harrisonbacteria bacterium RIFCSPHIGHO2_01_FULL_44_13]OGY66333.1 MAG: hypothetical protein A3A16_00270 [Candidatus Harrisonbacteria bacterium RIFCSPLOWO2_01_FULL_44_18]